MKTLLVYKAHSVIDVITNSSSELFVSLNKDKEIIRSLIEEIHPEYLDEYEELKGIDELTPNELDTYFQFACSPTTWSSVDKSSYPVLPGFTFEELYEEDEENTWSRKPGCSYKLRNNDGENKTWGDFVTEENFNAIKEKLDPNREMQFLFSIGDNPEWDYQEKFEEFMFRFHLG